MKISEVHVKKQVNEGPLDFVQNVAAGAKGLATGGLSGAKAGYQQSASQNAAGGGKDVANEFIKRWNTITGQLSAAGQQPTVQQLQQFVKQSAPTATIPAPGSVTPQLAHDFIAKSVQQHLANSALGQSEPESGSGQASAKPAADTANPAQTQAVSQPQASGQPPQQKLMTKDQLLQWISRNSENVDDLLAFQSAIGAGSATPATQQAPTAQPPAPNYGKPNAGYSKVTMNVPAAKVPNTKVQMPTNMIGSKPTQTVPATARPAQQQKPATV